MHSTGEAQEVFGQFTTWQAAVAETSHGSQQQRWHSGFATDGGNKRNQQAGVL